MAFIFNTEEDRKEMLSAIGASSVDELFELIPNAIKLDRSLKLPKAMGELELTQHMAKLAAKNANATNHVCFMGAGSYDHFIPAVVDSLASRGEFYTSYTPYQPEVSQGNLQVMFEYQTLICELTGMDVSNASLYDGGSSVAEAALMCMSVGRKTGNVVVADSVHPEYRSILSTYFKPIGTELRTAPHLDGCTGVEAVIPLVDDNTACVVIQYPNFFGCVEEVKEIADAVHKAGSLLVVSFDPISLGLLKRPGDLGADVVIAEGHTLGTPMSFGGPFLGIMACREQFIRRMPGRIAGQTIDRNDRRCWVLTLQTREQHIRREKATSNICTNQGLFALRAAIYLSLMGPQGLRQVANLCLQKSHYAAETIKSERLTVAWKSPFVKEFVVRDRKNKVAKLLDEARAAGFLAGVPLGTWYPELNDCFLVSVTEKRTRTEIDSLTNHLRNQNVLEPANHA